MQITIVAVMCHTLGAVTPQSVNELAAEHVDNAGIGFDAFVADEIKSAVLRGYVRAWLNRAFRAYDSAKLAVI
jgi:hypothetical protein